MSREPVGGGDSIVVRGRTATIVRTIAEIDLDNLTREVQDVGGTAIWWGVLYARAQSDVGRAKLHVGVMEGQFAKAERTRRFNTGEKITDKIIEEETALSPDVIRAREELIDAEERAAMLRSVTFAVEQKQRTLTAMTGAIAREISAGWPKSMASQPVFWPGPADQRVVGTPSKALPAS